MTLAEAPVVALALIRTFGDAAYTRAARHADAAGRAGHFTAAYHWRRVAEIIRNQDAMERENRAQIIEDADDEPVAPHPWMAAAVRWMRIHVLLAQRTALGWDPFGPDLAPWQALGLIADDTAENYAAAWSPSGPITGLPKLGALPCTACAARPVCTEAARALADRMCVQKLDRRARAHRPANHQGAGQIARSDGSSPTHAERAGPPYGRVLGPCEAQMARALSACWLDKAPPVDSPPH